MVHNQAAAIAALCGGLVFGCNQSSSGDPGEPGSSETRDDGSSGSKSRHRGGHASAPSNAHGNGRHHVELSTEALEQIDIRVRPAGTGNLEDTAVAPATIEPDVDRVAHIAPLVEGQIVELEVTLGDEVKAGQTLAVIRSVALGEARAALREAEAALEVAKASFERQKKLRDEGIASERELLEARGEYRKARARQQAARAKLRTFGVRRGQGARYPLRSQLGGTVIEQHAAVGETKGPKDALFVVADLDEVWAIGRVYERDIPKVEVGMEARLRLDAYPERTWTGKVTWMASTVDEQTRNLPIRVVLDNENALLRPGLFGSLALSLASSKDNTVLVPVDAVQKLHGSDVLFVPTGKERRFRAVEVELGAAHRGRVEIVDGLEAGQRIVTRGAFDLKAAATASARSAAHKH